MLHTRTPSDVGQCYRSQLLIVKIRALPWFLMAFSSTRLSHLVANLLDTVSLAKFKSSYSMIVFESKQRPVTITPTGPPIPPLRLSRESIWNVQTNAPIFSITSSSAPGSLSSKSLLTFVRTATGQTAGTLRYHSMSDSVTLTLNGAETRLTNPDGMYSRKLRFSPINFPGAKWTWKSEKSGCELNDGRCRIAQLIGDVLIVDSIGLVEPGIDEVVLTAMALWGLKQKREGGGSAAAFEAFGNIAQLGGAGA